MRFSKRQSHFAGYILRVVISSIGNITLYDPQIRGYFRLFTVILCLLKSVIGLTKNYTVIKRRAKASSIVGVSRRTSVLFFGESWAQR